MCRAADYPPFDGEEIGAMLRAQEIDDLIYDPHEDHGIVTEADPSRCEKCQVLAERDAAWT